MSNGNFAVATTNLSKQRILALLRSDCLYQTDPKEYNAAMKKWHVTVVLLILALMAQPTAAQGNGRSPLIIQPGDSWTALALRFQVAEAALHALNPHMNPQWTSDAGPR